MYFIRWSRFRFSGKPVWVSSSRSADAVRWCSSRTKCAQFYTTRQTRTSANQPQLLHSQFLLFSLHPAIECRTVTIPIDNHLASTLTRRSPFYGWTPLSCSYSTALSPLVSVTRSWLCCIPWGTLACSLTWLHWKNTSRPQRQYSTTTLHIFFRSSNYLHNSNDNYQHHTIFSQYRPPSTPDCYVIFS